MVPHAPEQGARVVVEVALAKTSEKLSAELIGTVPACTAGVAAGE